VPYTDAWNVLFKIVNLHLIANSPIVNKGAKLWCLAVPNIVQNSLVNSLFIFVNCLLHAKYFSFTGVYGANTYSVRRLLEDFNVVLPIDDCKGGLLLIRFLVMNSFIGLIIIILLVCFSPTLVILEVMGGEGYRELIESLIDLYVMKSV